MLKLLIENCELLEFAVNAGSHWPSGAVQLAPQLGKDLPVKLAKKFKYKEAMADRFAEIYFIWIDVVCYPQVLKYLPHVHT